MEKKFHLGQKQNICTGRTVPVGTCCWSRCLDQGLDPYCQSDFFLKEIWIWAINYSVLNIKVPLLCALYHVKCVCAGRGCSWRKGGTCPVGLAVQGGIDSAVWVLEEEQCGSQYLTSGCGWGIFRSDWWHGKSSCVEKVFEGLGFLQLLCALSCRKWNPKQTRQWKLNLCCLHLLLFPLPAVVDSHLMLVLLFLSSVFPSVSFWLLFLTFLPLVFICIDFSLLFPWCPLLFPPSFLSFCPLPSLQHSPLLHLLRRRGLEEQVSVREQLFWYPGLFFGL